MNFARIASLSLIVTLFCGVLPAEAQVKLATVNAAKVFNEMQETKDLKAKMENDQKALQAQDLDKKTKLTDLQNARNGLKSDSPQYDDANKALMQSAVEYEVWKRVQGANIERTQKTQMVSIFNKITAAVQEVAAAKGLDLVIAEQRPEIPDNIDAVNVDQLRQLINQRNVLFATPTVDISNEVIAAMDAKYKSGK